MAIGRRLRYEVFRRDGFRCKYCGAEPGVTQLQVDHIVPEALGGTDEPSNLATACEPCNSGKASMPADAAIVANVARDQERWARAMEAARTRRAAQSREHTHSINEFIDLVLDLRNTHRDTYELPQCPTSRTEFHRTLTQFLELGLGVDELVDAMSITMRMVKLGKIYGDDEQQLNGWRYFCGCAWRVLRDIQAEARAIIDAGTDAIEQSIDTEHLWQGWDEVERGLSERNGVV